MDTQLSTAIIILKPVPSNLNQPRGDGKWYCGPVVAGSGLRKSAREDAVLKAESAGLGIKKPGFWPWL